MYLTISLTSTPDHPATDLGFLLHKHPDKSQSFPTSHGLAHVFYPEASAELCTVALLLEIDPVALARKARSGGRGGRENPADGALAQYVNDRPYAASSLLAVALGQVFRTALRGDCVLRPELPEQVRPVRVEIPVLPARGGPELVRRLFGPLGWHTVDVTPLPLDETYPEWGESRYVRLVLEGEARLADALRQLYVLLPVLDGAKHYWVSADEVDKLLRAGEGWLADHPEQALIAARYLARRRNLTERALEQLELARLAEVDDAPEEQDPEGEDEPGDDGTPAAEPPADAPADAPVRLAMRRREALLDVLRATGAARVLDLGCGEGQLLGALLKEKGITEIVGTDVSTRSLTIAARRLRLDRMGERQRSRITLFQGSLAYTDARLAGYDAAVLSEVIEHVDEERLPALEYAVFGAARPRTVLVTTPNVEYNVRWETLPAGRHRHGDHRFEWDRATFRAWARGVAARHGYGVTHLPVGDEDPEVGPPTQLAVFTLDPTAADTTDTRETPLEGRTA
ncbi:3' terminal RNA ribose 2'-O-methyltransferase Hen1 [Streptomyces sp. BI20]|uniref:3' terminal RNA ribose 2'-O-methyltransferase Hen1 n=1 Tax=Streptomyces sp. BI20 TaxID=3403460 RepID=UPI003C72521F